MSQNLHVTRLQARLTPLGAWVIGLCVLMVGGGLASTDGLLTAFGLGGFFLIGISYLLGRVNLLGWEIRCEGAAVVHVKQTLAMRWKVKKERGMIDGYGLRVDVTMLGGMKDEWEIRSIAPSEEMIRDVQLTALQRAVGEMHSVGWSSTFPMGLWVFERASELRHGVSIFPQLMRSKLALLTGAMHDAALMHGMNFGRGGGEWLGLRTWQAGDAPRRVHAGASSRSYARGTGLVVSEYEPPGYLPQRVLVLFHSHGRDGRMIRPELFEHALSHACGVLKFLVQQSIPVTFVADFDHFLERRCDTRAQMGEIFHLLSKARRHAGTEVHDLEQMQYRFKGEDFWIVISDMEQESWRGIFSSRGASCFCLSPKVVRKK